MQWTILDISSQQFYLQMTILSSHLQQKDDIGSYQNTDYDVCEKEKTFTLLSDRFILTQLVVEVTGLEPAASTSRTWHSTKLSYTSVSAVHSTPYL